MHFPHGFDQHLQWPSLLLVNMSKGSCENHIQNRILYASNHNLFKDNARRSAAWRKMLRKAEGSGGDYWRIVWRSMGSSTWVWGLSSSNECLRHLCKAEYFHHVVRTLSNAICSIMNRYAQWFLGYSSVQWWSSLCITKVQSIKAGRDCRCSASTGRERGWRWHVFHHLQGMGSYLISDTRVYTFFLSWRFPAIYHFKFSKTQKKNLFQTPARLLLSFSQKLNQNIRSCQQKLMGFKLIGQSILN